MNERSRPAPASQARGAVMILGVAALALSAAVRPAQTPEWATLEVVVRGSDGHPVPNARVAAQAKGPRRQSRARLAVLERIDSTSHVTDAEGAVVFQVPPGRWSVHAYGVRDRGWVERNPFVPDPEVVLAPGETQVVELRLARGVPLRATLTVEGDIEGRFGLNLVPDGAERDELADWFSWTPASPEIRRMLAPGVWTVRPQGPSGFLLRELILDGAQVLSGDLKIDLLEDPSPRHVDAIFVAESKITGTIDVAKHPPGLVLQAQLVEAGAWSADERVRRGSDVDLVRRGRNEDQLYELPVPSGVWRVQPVAEVGIDSSPEFVELQLGVGDERSVAFEVEVLGGDRDFDALRVMTARNEGGTLPQSRVEVYDASGLVAEDSSDASGRVTFYELEAERRYRIVANHPDALAQSTEIVFRPGRADRDRTSGPPGFRATDNVLLHLHAGAGLAVEGRGAAGQPQAGVEVTVERFLAQGEDAAVWDLDGSEALPGDPRAGLASGDVRDAEVTASVRAHLLYLDRADSNARTLTTGPAGVAEANGFVAGDYAVRAKLSGADAALGAVAVRTPSERWVVPGEELELRVASDELVQLEARVLPRARFTTRLVCSDGGAMPETASVEVYRALEVVGGVTLGVEDEEPALLLEKKRLRRGGRLDIGPLDRGAFHLAVRPDGFDRWTWAFEAEERSSALALSVEGDSVRGGDAIALGEYVIECDPAVDLVLEPANSTALRDGRLTADVELFDLTYLRGGRPSQRDDPEEESFRQLPKPKSRWAGNVLELRGLPAIELRLRVVLEHPEVSPSGVLVREFRLEPQRGSYVRRVIELGAAAPR